MAYSSNLEVSFVALRKDIERYIGAGEYAHTKTLIEKAMTLCTKIFETTPDPEKKQIMRDNAIKLKQMYEECKRRLGEWDELTYDTPAATGADRKPVVSRATSRNADKKTANQDNSEDNIQYVFRGINVQDFLCVDANEIVSFDDVKGMEKEKALIQREFFLSEKQRAFNAQIGKKPKTFMLLYGVPGTGKTFFAKAISEELKRHSDENIHFFSVVGSQLSDSKVGATEKNIQAIFEFCGQFERCVLFIDEFDSLAPDRKQATGDPTAVSRVTTLLQMMDGFSSSLGTLLITSTNCPYNLDGAVLSRANVRIEIPLPTQEVIYSVLHSKISNRLAPDVDLSGLATRLESLQYSNRDIKNFIGNLQDSLSAAFQNSEMRGELQDPDLYCYTKEMIENAFKEIHPTVKQSDIMRIEQFKLMGE